MQHLRANTEVDVPIGPFVSIADGFTVVTTADLSTVDNANIIKHDVQTGIDIAARVDGPYASDAVDGMRYVTLTTTDTNTEGMLTIMIEDVSLCLPVTNRFMVLSEAAYDSLYVAKDTGFMDVNIKAISEDTTAADNLELFTEVLENGTGLIDNGTFKAGCLTSTEITSAAGCLLADGAHGGSSAVITAERIVVASTTATEPAIKLTGNTSGAGFETTGGASNGAGIKATGGATNGIGIHGVGVGTGDGMQLQGGTSGDGLYAEGGSVSGGGAQFYGNNNGYGVFMGGGGNGDGLWLDKAGTGEDLRCDNTLLGADGSVLISSDAQDLSATLDVNAKLLAAASPNNFDPANDAVASVTLVDTTTDLTNPPATGALEATSQSILTDTGTTLPATLAAQDLQLDFLQAFKGYWTTVSDTSAGTIIVKDTGGSTLRTITITTDGTERTLTGS